MGEGGTCTAYLVRHKFLGELRVMKTVRDYGNQREAYRECAQREIQALSTIRGKGIPVLYDLWEEDKRNVIVEEYFEGKSLADYMPKDLIEAIKILEKFCETLACVHQSGYVHLDVKPEHLLVADTEVAIIDYGNCTKTGEPFPGWATGRYLAPECYEQKAASESMDIYSFGMVMKEFGDRISIHSGLAGCEAPNRMWGELIEDCTASFARERPQSIDEIRVRLEGIADMLQTHQQRIYKEETPDCMRIFVRGYPEGAGATTFAMGLCQYLSSTCRVAYFADNHGQFIENLLDRQVTHLCGRGKSIYGWQYGGVNIYGTEEAFWQDCERGNRKIIAGDNRENVLVFDGEDCREKCLETEKAGDIHILVLGRLSDWTDSENYYRKLPDWNEDAIVVGNLMNSRIRMELSRRLGRNVVAMPYIANVLKLSGEARRFYAQLISTNIRWKERIVSGRSVRHCWR